MTSGYMKKEGPWHCEESVLLHFGSPYLSPHCCSVNLAPQGYSTLPRGLMTCI